MLINGIGDLFSAHKPRACASGSMAARPSAGMGTDTDGYAGPCGGGWGTGEMAAAGTLMMGDKLAASRAPPAMVPMPARAPKAAVTDDLGMEVSGPR